jgi:Pentapeptide repeats (8 copies)
MAHNTSHQQGRNQVLKKQPHLHIIGVAAAVAAAVIYGAWRWREGRAQNDALQKYLDQMGRLLAEEGLRSSEKDSDVRVSARSQTLTVLQRLGPDRKQKLLRYLYESHLIGKDDPIVSLAGSDLSEADLRRADLSETNLREANLSEANLREADLSKADLSEANLSEANLRGASLSGADLSKADLTEAGLRGANLRKTDLSEANLREADLNEAQGVTNEELEQTVQLLEKATMPDGSKHE